MAGGVVDDINWRAPIFRQTMVSRIEEAILQCGAPTTKSAAEMENQVFLKANTKNEYMSFVARLILHIKEMATKYKLANANAGAAMGGAQNIPPGQMVRPMGRGQQMGMINQQNTINMNQMEVIGMNSQQQHLIGQGVSQPQKVVGVNMPQQGGLVMQQSDGVITAPQAGGNINIIQNQISMNMPQRHPGTMHMSQQTGGKNMPQQLGVMNVSQQQSHMSNLQQNQQQSQTSINSNFINTGQMPQQIHNNVQSNVQQMQTSGVPNPQMQQIQNQINNSMIQQQFQNVQHQPQQIQMTNPQHQQIRGMIVGGRMVGPQGHQINVAQQRKGPPHRPMGPNVDNSGMSNQQYSPGQMHIQRPNSGNFTSPNANISSQGMPNSGPNQVAFVNSPQNMLHPHGSPAAGASSIRQFSSQMVPSPNLNTPMPSIPTPSPRNAEEQACMEKIKELRRYTDLLQRMIDKIGTDDLEKSSKMKKLLDLLINPNQRVSMEILLKCEIALKNMERQQQIEGMMGSSGPPSQPMPTKDQVSPFQQIQDAILTTLKNPTSSHTFQKFKPAIEALTGQSAGSHEVHEDSDLDTENESKTDIDVPWMIQRELRILDPRFNVKINKMHNRPGYPIQLIASLNDDLLPKVPPLKIMIPIEYPDENPSLMDLKKDYGSTSLLTSISHALKSRMLYLPEKFTVLELLNNWEMSVRQSCNPNPSNFWQRLGKKKIPSAGNFVLSFL